MPEHTNINYPDTLDWLASRSNRASKDIRDLTRKRVAGIWLRPDTFVNSWDDAGAPYAPLAYRLMNYNSLQFRGHITGGASGTVAFTIIPPIMTLIEHNLSYLTDVGTVGNFSVGRIEVDYLTGDVTITYPAG
jgi:hypothetical protein